MLPKSLSRLLLCVVCAISLFSFGCGGQRPEPIYVDMPDKPAIQQCCHVITEFYILCTEVCDATETRLNNCKVALYLDGVYKDLGAEAYYEAVTNLTPEERREYRRYMKHEISKYKVIKKLTKLSQKAIAALPYVQAEVTNDPVGAILYAGSLCVVIEQFYYAVDALDQFIEYDALYDKALEYKGR